MNDMPGVVFLYHDHSKPFDEGKYWSEHDLFAASCARYIQADIHEDLVAAKDAELEALRAWKAEALAVEAEWDDQAVGKALGLPLASSIRKGILPAVEALRAEVEKLKCELVTARHDAEMLAHLETLPDKGQKEPKIVTTNPMACRGCGKPKELHEMTELDSLATDANQADAAVREWCGDDEDRIFRYGFELFLVVFGRECFPGFAVSLSLCTRLTQSDPEQKITALLAAAEALKVAGGGA